MTSMSSIKKRIIDGLPGLAGGDGGVAAHAASGSDCRRGGRVGYDSLANSQSLT